MPPPRKTIRPATRPAPAKPPPQDEAARRSAELLAKARAVLGRSPVPTSPRDE